MSGCEGRCGPGLEKGEGGGKGQQRPKLALGPFGRYVAALLPGGFVALELTLTPEDSIRQACSTITSVRDSLYCLFVLEYPDIVTRSFMR
jgi:hypothetical protein